MKKFDEWNNLKKDTHKKERNILPKIREIWWCSVGVNIGVEEDGKNKHFERPVLVLKVFSRKSFLGIPLTSAGKSESKFYFKIIYNNKEYFVILSQVRLFSTKRLLRKITRIDTDTFSNIKSASAKLFGL